MKTRPYVIVAPAWSAHAGVRVLHLLCHELNGLGLDASLLLTAGAAPAGEPLLEPGLRTPVINTLMAQHWAQINEDAIVIQADSLPGNPFGATRIVRYVLAKEEAAATTAAQPDPAEYRVYHSRSLPARRQASQRVLYLPPVDLGLFHDKAAPARDQDMLWLGAGVAPAAETPPNLVRITDAWPASPAERAAQLRRTRLLHSFEPGALLNIEAVLCGAIVVLRQGAGAPPFSRADLEAHEATCGGFAFGDSPFELERAIRTRQELVENLRYQQASFRQRLLDFVHETQLHFK